MRTNHRRMLAIPLIFVGAVLFMLFIDFGLLPMGCSPQSALLVGGRPASRGAFGFWACQGQTSVVFGLIIPACLFALAAMLALWPRVHRGE